MRVEVLQKELDGTQAAMKQARDASAATATAAEAALRHELAGARAREEILQKELEGTQAAMKQVATAVATAGMGSMEDKVRQELEAQASQTTELRRKLREAQELE